MVCIVFNVKINIMSKKILIVDDNEFMIEIMTFILMNKGYEVMTLYKGDRVLDTVLADHPDLIILDISLPDADGREVCKLLKMNTYTRKLPVIICSANDDVDEALKQSGAPDDVLHKPFDTLEFIEKIELQLAA